jgi:site-specific DNA-methyltransferase (adenine-specific)
MLPNMSEALPFMKSHLEVDRVVVRDAFELLASLPPESIDLVLTDPPYESLELHRSRGTTTRLTTNWFATVPNERLPELLRLVYRALKPDRHFYLFCDEVTADVVKQQQGIGANRQVNGARRCSCGLNFWKEIVWAKTTNDGTKIRGGTGYHFRAANERILFFEKGKRALNDLGIPDVLLAPRSGVPGPAVKPGAVIRTLISQSTLPGELVIDPFCGSGVVGVEALGLQRHFVMGDIDLAYLDPLLAPYAPEGAVMARTSLSAAEPLEPPALERFSSGEADLTEMEAARACGWLDEDDGLTDALLALIALRPVEREPAVRRSLRAERERPGEPDLLRAWRSWALGGRRK